MRSNREGLTGAIRGWLSRQPIVMSFRNWRSGKSGHFPKSRLTTRKHHRIQMLRSFSLVFLLICATLAIIAVSQPTRPKFTDTAGSVKSSTLQSSGQVFPQSEIRCNERNELVRIVSDIVPSLLFVVESDSVDDFERSLLRIEDSLLSVISQNKLKLFVIFLDKDLDSTQWKQLKRAAAQAPGSIPVWLTQESREMFLDNVSIPDTPIWMLIDENQKVRRMTTSSRLRYADVVDLISS